MATRLDNNTVTGRTSADGSAPGPFAGRDAVALIRVFDALLEEGADIDHLLGTAADIGQCVAGVSGEGQHRAFDFHGAVIVDRPVAASSRPVWGGHEVWVARFGPRHDLDALLLERLSVACGITLRHAHRRLHVGADLSTVELVVNQIADEADRRRALAILGLEPARAVRLVAYDGPPAGVSAMVEQLVPHAQVWSGPVGALWAVVTTGEVASGVELPRGARMGIGLPVAALEASVSWSQARTALRFALPSARAGVPGAEFEAVAVPYERLGAFSLLADYLPIDRLADNSDLVALDDLVNGPGGAEMQRTLEVVGATESVRRAAAILHMHHNTVAHRVARAELALGYSVSEPYGRARLMLGLVVQRLRDNVGRSYADEPIRLTRDRGHIGAT